MVKWIKQVWLLHPHSFGSENEAIPDTITKQSSSCKVSANLLAWTRPHAPCLKRAQWPQSLWKGGRIILTKLDKSGLNLSAWETSTPATNQENWRRRKSSHGGSSNVREMWRGLSERRFSVHYSNSSSSKRARSSSPTIHKHGLFESDNTANVNFLKDTQIKTGPYFWSPLNLRAKFHFVLHNNKTNRFEVFLQSTFLSPDKAEQWGLLFKKGKPALLQSPVQHCHLGAEPSKPYP